MKSNRTHENTVRIFQNCLVGWIGVFALQILASGPYVWHPWSRTTNHYCHFWSHVASLTKNNGPLRLVLYIPTLKKTCKQHCGPTQQLKLSFSIWSIYENMKPFEVIQSSPHLYGEHLVKMFRCHSMSLKRYGLQTMCHVLSSSSWDLLGFVFTAGWVLNSLRLAAVESVQVAN